jgi:hypothetical protein
VDTVRNPAARAEFYRARNRIDPPKLPRFAPRTRMRVLQGPLQVHIGVLAALRPHERVLVLLRMLGGERRVELAQDVISAI